ncbi:hypothetical protein Acr_27g0004100 [Actinidia rufa]|uniref:Uncharacterized protein n=1 Tax=Actinidia rufa TaxID=165716 RepID=A0A7J0H6L3_9ERIC|nr:hypothetical protein Acr_27g0004100 [Actinidia rufa]
MRMWDPVGLRNDNTGSGTSTCTTVSLQLCLGPTSLDISSRHVDIRRVEVAVLCDIIGWDRLGRSEPNLNRQIRRSVALILSRRLAAA